MPQPPYAIPEESSARSAAQIYERYRLRLDEELSRQRRERIIDVKPSRVSLEEGSRSSLGARGASKGTSGAEAEKKNASAALTKTAVRPSGARRGAPARPEPQRSPSVSPEEAFIYEPSLEENKEVILKSPPTARGIFVDFLA